MSRRTVAKGAAWTMPVVAVGATAPMAAASPACVPVFTVVGEQSAKCCNGPTKNMKVTIRITDTGNCLTETAEVCVTNVTLGNNGTIGQVVFDGDCTTEGGTVTVYLLDPSNCTVNLLVYYSIDGNAALNPVPLQSDNIPQGNTDAACVPPTTPL